MSQNDTSRKLHLVFNEKTVRKTILCQLARKYPTMDFSVEGGKMTESIGYVQVLVSAPNEEVINAAISWLFSQGVEVKHLELVNKEDYQQAA